MRNVIWEKKGFADFSSGILGNGGQNIYVSAKGILQRIFNYDVNGDGYPDLLFANSQSMGERPHLHVYDPPYDHDGFYSLPSSGSYDAVMTDLDGDGYDDLVIACQHNGTHSDVTAVIYFGSESGLTEKYKMELPVPNSTGVAAGDLNGDGRPDLAFISHDKIRVFYQSENGVLPFEYKDLPVPAVSIAAADIDGDGFCDLYVKYADGSAGVLWGSPEGISADSRTIIDLISEGRSFIGMSTSMGRKPAYRGWRAAALLINGRVHLFTAAKGHAVFYACDENRRVEEAFRLRCEGAVGAASGDLDGDGFTDIALAACTDIDSIQSSYVFWGSEKGFDGSSCAVIETRSAQDVEISDLFGNGRDHLIVCQGGTSEVHDTQSFVLGFGKDRLPVREASLESSDAMKVLSGRSRGGSERQIVVINHETGRVRGDENIYIYLGGPDGYAADRRIELPGFAAVEGKLFDYNDDGYVDLLVSNCSENAVHLDQGSFLYTGGPDGLRRDRRENIPSVRGHGAAVGDFRRCGYLDIAIGGFRNRELRIFRGGPDGYDTEHPDRIVLGPGPEGYSPPKPKDKSEWSLLSKPEEDEIYMRYGEVRWLFTADFNNDGWLDLFVSQITGPYCYILWGGPEGFGTARMTKLAADGVASANAADLDSDGYLDLVLAGHMSTGKKENIYESYVTIYWGGPEGYRESRKTQLPVTCANSVTIGDFNNDGILDIYATSYNNKRSRDIYSYIFFGREGGIYSADDCRLLFNNSGCGCMAGDFDGDGCTDLAVACHKAYGDHKARSFVFHGGPEGLSDGRKTELPTKGPHGMCSVDPGNIMDRSEEEYYYSEVRPVPEGMKVKSAAWEARVPEKGWIRMHMMHRETEEECRRGRWEDDDIIEINNGQEIEDRDMVGGYIRYRMALGARCFCGTPRVRSVKIEFALLENCMDRSGRE